MHVVSNSYLRSVPSPDPMVSVGAMMRFWAAVLAIASTLIAFFKTEVSSVTSYIAYIAVIIDSSSTMRQDNKAVPGDLSVAAAYRQMIDVISLKCRSASMMNITSHHVHYCY